MTFMKPWLLVLVSVMLITACSNNPLMRTSSATSTEAADEIVNTLDTAAPARTPKPAADQAVPTVPADVSNALLPPLQPDTASDGRFDVNAQGVAARSFFESLVAGTRYNAVVDPALEATISLSLHDVTVPEVMDIVADLYHLNIRRTGRLYRIGPDRVETRLFAIDYLDFKRKGESETRVSSGQVTETSTRNGNNNGATGNGSSGTNDTQSLVGTTISTQTASDFWSDLNRTLGLLVSNDEGGQVIVNAGAGLVMVRGRAQTLDTVEDYLRRTELIMQRQVVLEAKILEVALNEGYQQGINWSDLQRKSSITASDGLPADFTAQSLAGQTINTSTIGGLFSATFREGSFSALIQLLGTQGNVQILSSPRISTVNNQKAVIKVGTDEFFVTDIDFNQNNANLTGNNDTTTSVQLTPFFSGISLDVTPQIAKDGAITLHVHPSVSEVVDQQKVITIGDRDVTLPLAQSTVRETDSVIRADSGQIVVIGGLIQNSSEDNNATVPFFSEIPLVGELFKQRKFKSRKSELVILLRPVVVGQNVMADDVAASRQRMEVLRQLLQSAESVKPEPETAPD